MKTAIGNGLGLGIPTAVLAAAISDEGKALRNALLYGGLTTAVTAGLSKWLRSRDDNRSKHKDKSGSIISSKVAPTSQNTEKVSENPKRPDSQTNTNTNTNTKTLKQQSSTEVRDTATRHASNPSLATQLLAIRYRPRSARQFLVEHMLKDDSTAVSGSGDQKTSTHKNNKPATTKSEGVFNTVGDAQMRAADAKRMAANSVIQTVADIWNGITSDEDYGLPRLGPIEYMKFLGNNIGSSFAKAWYSVAKSRDKAHAQGEAFERKHKPTDEALHKEFSKGIKSGSPLYMIGYGLTPKAMAPHTAINAAEAYMLNPDNPDEHRGGLTKGTARGEQYAAYIADSDRAIKDTANKAGMTPDQLALANFGSDMLINLTADPLTVLTSGVGYALKPLASVSARAAQLRELRRIRALRNATKAQRALIAGKNAGRGITALSTEAISEMLETQITPHYDLVVQEVPEAAAAQAKLINQQRKEKGLWEIPEDWLTKYLMDRVSMIKAVNRLREYRLKRGADIYNISNID